MPDLGPLLVAIQESLFVDAGMGQRESITDTYTPEGQAIFFIRSLADRGYRIVPIDGADHGRDGAPS